MSSAAIRCWCTATVMTSAKLGSVLSVEKTIFSTTLIKYATLLQIILTLSKTLRYSLIQNYISTHMYTLFIISPKGAGLNMNHDLLLSYPLELISVFISH